MGGWPSSRGQLVQKLEYRSSRVGVTLAWSQKQNRPMCLHHRWQEGERHRLTFERWAETRSCRAVKAPWCCLGFQCDRKAVETFEQREATCFLKIVLFFLCFPFLTVQSYSQEEGSTRKAPTLRHGVGVESHRGPV